jgi:SOS response regulatory protein OraA/RecX
MRADDEYKKALKAALNRLKAADRFQKEIEAPLINAGFSAETVRDVVSYLIERRYIDDRRTTINAVERRSGRRAVARERIRAELLKRGAPEEVLEEVLRALPDAEASASLVDLLRAKYGAAGDQARTDRSTRARAGRFLASRGFDGEAIEAALNGFFGSFDEDVD